MWDFKRSTRSLKRSPSPRPTYEMDLELSSTICHFDIRCKTQARISAQELITALPNMKTTCVATLMSLPVAILAAGTQFCEVTTTANCRACPYDDDVYCPSIYTLYTGFYYEFTCRTIGGEVDGDE